MWLPHPRVEVLLPLLVALAELAVAVAIRMNLLVLHPQQTQVLDFLTGVAPYAKSTLPTIAQLATLNVSKTLVGHTL